MAKLIFPNNSKLQTKNTQESQQFSTNPSTHKYIDSQQLTFGDLTLNSNFLTIQNKKGKTSSLRRKEYQLLRFLVNNLHSVIDKFILLDLIWEYSSFAGSNTLEVHLSSLRKKIKSLSKLIRIESIRGAGYRLTFN